MAIAEPNVAHELTNTIISLQETICNVKQRISKDQLDFVFDLLEEWLQIAVRLTTCSLVCDS
jgi:hypothetical protein